MKLFPRYFLLQEITPYMLYKTLSWFTCVVPTKSITEKVKVLFVGIGGSM